MAEDEYDEEDLDPIEEGGDFDMDELSAEDRAAMDEGVAHVYSIIGEDTSISLQTIQDSLWYYYFDKEETVNFLLDMIAKQKSAQAKEAKAAAKGANINRAIRKQRQAHLAALPGNQKSNGRPIPMSAQNKSSPAKQSLANLLQVRTGGSSLSSLRMKMAGQQSSATNRVAQLNRDKMPIEEQSKREEAKPATAVRPNALSTLAQQSKANSGSALQRLAARHKPESSDIKEGSGSDNTLSSSSALAKLSLRHKDKATPSSLSDLAKKSRLPSPQSSGFQAIKANQLSNAKTSKLIETEDNTKKSAWTTQSLTNPSQTNNAEQPGTEATQSRNPASLYPDNPLCARPSSVAQFLFTPLTTNVGTWDLADNKKAGAAKSLNTTVQRLMPSSKNLSTFKFDSPSPDDIVHAAQSQRRIGANKSAAASS
ncbi:hypothetical protein VKS41_005808 [Umbelopsis sp. WA50703]